MSRYKIEKVIGFKVDLLGADTQNVKLVLLCQGNEERPFEVDPLFVLGVISDLAKVSRAAQQISATTNLRERKVGDVIGSPHSEGCQAAGVGPPRFKSGMCTSKAVVRVYCIDGRERDFCWHDARAVSGDEEDE